MSRWPVHGELLTLRDRRILGYAQFGDPAGMPLFFFHGGGSSRLTRHPDDSIMDDLGIRLITIDRPGIGLSTFQPRRCLLDWPDDVTALADSLNIDRFAVLGWSAGGPHALACAYKIPDRLRAVGVISGLAPLHWPGISASMSALRLRLPHLARRMPPFVYNPLSRAAHDLRRAARLRRRAIRNAHDAADALIEVPEEIRAIHRQGFIELTRAWEWHRAVELAMIARPWGFALGDIRMEVHLWYGSRDPTTPLYMAQYLKRSIPHARLTVWPHEGHHVGFTHWREVLKTLST
ncbi:MAG: alpha/beta hydrolase [Chloroflexota bacterium]